MKKQFFYFLKLFFILSTFILPFQSAGAKAPTNFGEAKRLAKQIYADNRFTFYCGCKYDKHGKVDLKSCGYQIQSDKRRARRLEWEHIVPVSLWGKELSCWNNFACCKKNKRCYKGRACCRDKDKRFALMEADLHNLVPEIGELNALRSNYAFNLLPHVSQGHIGVCQFKIDQKRRQVEPRDSVKGMVARAYLYMRDTYGIPLSESQILLFKTWHRKYPPSLWEVARNYRIAKIQGNFNPYVLPENIEH